MEIWKDINGYVGFYQVSNYGNVRALERIDCKNHRRPAHLCRLIKNDDGYYKIGLSKDGIEKRFFVHRLVAIHFIENPLGYECVNHIDENKTNNNAKNLEWCSREYNNNYGTRNKRISQIQGIRTAMIDIKTREVIKVFDSANIAAQYVNGDESSICKCRNGKRKTAYGYRWEVV